MISRVESKVVQNGEYFELEPEVDENDLHQKNIYENQKMQDQDTQSKNIEIDTQQVDPKQVFQNFYGETYSMFPARPQQQSNNNQQVEYETPIEKLNRIKSEIQELKDSLDLMNENQKEQISQYQKMNIINEIQKMEQDLTNISNNQDYQNIFQISGQALKSNDNIALLRKDFQNQVTKDLQSKIQQLSKQNQEQNEENKQQQAQIQIYLDKERNQNEMNNQYIDLEKRINYLEEILGKDKLKSENFPDQNYSILGKLETMENIVSKLSEKQLENLTIFIDKIKSQIDAIQDDKKTKEIQDNLNPANLKKISDLYDKMQSVSGTQEELPLLVERLESLRYVHEESAGYMVNMNTLTDLHEKVIRQLGNNENLLTSLNKNFESNLQNIEKNINNLESRIQNLDKN